MAIISLLIFERPKNRDSYISTFFLGSFFIEMFPLPKTPTILEFSKENHTYTDEKSRPKRNFVTKISIFLKIIGSTC